MSYTRTTATWEERTSHWQDWPAKDLASRKRELGLTVSVVIPASASNFIVGTFCAKYFLKEDVSSKRWLGVLCVFVGVILVLRTGGH